MFGSEEVLQKVKEEEEEEEEEKEAEKSTASKAEKNPNPQIGAHELGFWIAAGVESWQLYISRSL
ncbi:hypothetical protein ACJ72_03164 [Emergomyces africanus]|uniref:Uncharacterized protein n=1 Tax=Emergomyces africanus TaxID=1955775 RepID=A0A1B7P0D1_9EURO|nr:hypothetical protein ACJ72_03164 [Emergomyces africanus]